MVLLLALFALSACGTAASQERLDSFEAVSPIPFLPTPSPEPSATQLPTETATPAPSPRPSPTVGAYTSTPQPEIQLGSIQENPNNGTIEVWVGKWSTPPMAEGFDPTHIVVANGHVYYQSEGLTQVWSAESQSWVFPESFPYVVGEVVPVSLMGGRLEISDQSAAWRAHQMMVLSWLNNPGNVEFLRAVYGENEVVWDDLKIEDGSGQMRYAIKLIGLDGATVWPQVIIISNTGDVRYWTLADYIDDKATFGTKIDVSSPLWVVAGPKNWTEEGVREFVDERLDGPDTFGVHWASHGISFTKEGRLVWIATSTSQSNRTQTQHIPLGGQSGSEVDANLAEAYLASTIKSFEIITEDIGTISAIPLYAGTTIGFTDANTSGVNTPEEVDSIFPNPILRALE